MAARLGWNEERLGALRLGAVLHDVGKVNVRAEVLSKPGGLDEAELAEIRAHPVEGVWLLAGVPRSCRRRASLFHHERWDGGGYPTRRAGTGDPRRGRVLAVVDAYDATTSASLHQDDAIAEIELRGHAVRSRRRGRLPRGARRRRDHARPDGRRRLSAAA